MNLALVRYNAGNIQSVTYALERLGVTPLLTDDPEALRSADKVIFPGVGEASTAMQYLRQAGLDEVMRSLRQPVLGICLGMQLMCSHSDENDTPCLGIFGHQVHRFPDGALKVPHMGWNLLTELRSPLMQDLGDAPYVYFVHSYYVEPGPYTIALSDYGLPFSAALHRDNFYATQFHPEKSGSPGARILENFLRL
ncbi:MAG: imidazole glycerol phosphate synthase subunit HisH [Bacteroidia bacterium]|nr:imidazole glycerol phosphate synthase subunit HisH [Bacteroidia bacterium]